MLSKAKSSVKNIFKSTKQYDFKHEVCQTDCHAYCIEQQSNTEMHNKMKTIIARTALIYIYDFSFIYVALYKANIEIKNCLNLLDWLEFVGNLSTVLLLNLDFFFVDLFTNFWYTYDTIIQICYPNANAKYYSFLGNDVLQVHASFNISSPTE